MHQELNDDNASVRMVSYQGGYVLVRAFREDQETGSAVVVLGFIEGEYMISRKGPGREHLVPFTNVRPIENGRTEFTGLLRQMGERRPINFWDN